MSPITDSQLHNYADILVNFALNSGSGVKKGEVVFLQVPEAAKPLLIALYKAVLSSGAHPLIQYLPNDIDRGFFELASPEQIAYFPKSFMQGRAKQADHTISIIAETNKHELEGIDPKKIMDRSVTRLPYIKWLNRKEAQGKYTWTIAMYPTLAMATEANLTLEECWQEIVRSCFLDDPTPILKWQQISLDINQIKDKLNNLSIEKIHLQAKNTDLWLTTGPHRQWVGGGGRNIPSFEIFTSPDWRSTEGTIYFDMPLYRFGHIIKDISLEFHRGKVIKAHASIGNDLLKQMLLVKDADKVGEFSLTDIRHSRIKKFMAETLFDENYGGLYGNTHLALGMSFEECYSGSHPTPPSVLKKLGFNHSSVHTDIIATIPRTVIAYLANGISKVIYKNGMFTLDK